MFSVPCNTHVVAFDVPVSVLTPNRLRPFVVIFNEPALSAFRLSVKLPLKPDTSTTEPEMTGATLALIVGLFDMPVMLIFAQTAPALQVTVCDPALNELASKNTLSEAVGALAPAPPPVVADQCAVDEPSQVPVPPTQNRLAMSYT